MFQKKHCILCGSKDLKHFFDLDNSPRTISGLLRKADLDKDQKITIKLYQCYSCKLVQLPENVLTEQADFYVEYLMAATHSEYMIKHQEAQASFFVEKFGLKAKAVLEVGSGDGNFCSILKKHGVVPTGIEPSVTFYQEAVKLFPDLKFINDFLTPASQLESNKYDGFVARQVFEHLMNPGEVLQSLKKFLKPNAVGLIEVPSFEYSRKNNRFYDIFTDHVAYYTKQTLQRLLSDNGYEVEEIRDEADGEYIVAYFRLADYQDSLNQEFKDKYFNAKQAVVKFFADQQNQRIGIWGAGGKGVAFLSQFGIEASDSLILFDSDVHKQEKYTPGSHFLIEKPIPEKINQCDLIVITAMMYYKSIVAKLINNYHYQGKIAVVAPTIKILEEKTIKEIIA